MLEDLTVLDVGNILTAPKAARILGEFGAEVIKVERLSGAGFRRGPHIDEEDIVDGVTYAYIEYDRGKKSMGLNLAEEEGVEAFKRLAAEADVIVENQAPGRMEKFGIGYEDIREVNEDIIYCSISGYGMTGPWADKKGMDFMVQAFSGIAYQNAMRAGVEEPILTGLFIADEVTSVHAATSILAAIIEGEGTHIDVSMVDVFLSMFETPAGDYSAGNEIRPPGAPRPDAPYRGPIGTYETATDPMAIYMFGRSPQNLRQLWDALELHEWLEEDRFVTYEEMQEHADHVESTVVEQFKSKPREHWLERFWERDLIAGPFYTVEEAFEHEQLESRDVLSHETDPRIGDYLQVNWPAMYSAYDVGTDVPAAGFGEHTREILERLGYSGEEIDRFYDDDIVA